MPTGRQLLTNALVKLGVFQYNETPTAEALEIARQTFNTAIDSASNDFLNIHQIVPKTYLFEEGKSQYSLGPTGDWITERPIRIEKVQLLMSPLVIHAPVANFDYRGAGSSVAFVDTSLNNPTSWLWEFGTYGTSTLQNPTFVFPSDAPTIVRVRLTATNIAGSDSIEKDVETVAPTFTFTTPNIADYNGTDPHDTYYAPMTFPFMAPNAQPVPYSSIEETVQPGISGQNVVPNTPFFATRDGTLTVSVPIDPGQPPFPPNWFANTWAPVEKLTMSNPIDYSVSIKANWYQYVGPTGLWDFLTLASQGSGVTTSAIISLTVTTDGIPKVIPVLNGEPMGEFNYPSGVAKLEFQWIHSTGAVRFLMNDTEYASRMGGKLINYKMTLGGTPVISDDSGATNIIKMSDFRIGSIGRQLIAQPTTYNTSIVATDARFIGTNRFAVDVVNAESAITLTNTQSSFFGKLFEFQVNKLTDPVVSYVGISNSAFDPNVKFGNSSFVSYMALSDGTFISGGDSGTIGTPWQVNDKIGILIETYPQSSSIRWTRTKLQVFRNGVLQTPTPYEFATVNPGGPYDSYGVTGVYYPTPVADFSATPVLGIYPLTVDFTDLSTGLPTAWLWDFGDGTTSTLQNPSKVYSSGGSFTVSLTVTNRAGNNQKIRTGYIFTGAGTPVANFSGDVTSGPIPLIVNFTDTSTNLPTTWSWQFGDGTTSTLQNPTKTYSSVGNYNVRLLAANVFGSNAITKNSYIVATPPPPVADFSASPVTGTAPLVVNFTDTSTNVPTSWLWDFGDGTTSTDQNPTKTYTTAAIYTVSLQATNAYGTNTRTRTNLINVGGGALYTRYGLIQAANGFSGFGGVTGIVGFIGSSVPFATNASQAQTSSPDTYTLLTTTAIISGPQTRLGAGDITTPNQQVEPMPVSTVRSNTRFNGGTSTYVGSNFYVPAQPGDQIWITAQTFAGNRFFYSFTIVVGPSATVGEVYDCTGSNRGSGSFTQSWSITRQANIGGR